MFKWITDLFKPNKLKQIDDEDTLPEYISEFLCSKLIKEFPDSDWNIVTHCKGGDRYPIRILFRYLGETKVRTVGTVINWSSTYDTSFMNGLWSHIRYAIDQILVLDREVE